MKKGQLYLVDNIEGEMLEMKSVDESKKYLMENYVEEGTCHIDIESCILVQELEHPLKGLIGEIIQESRGK